MAMGVDRDNLKQTRLIAETDAPVYGEGFDTLDLKQAKALLEEL
jgi:hypothetical protein